MALAILFFWATIPISGLGVIVIWILASIDAYDQARKHNLKYGYSEEAIGAEHVEKWAYLRDKAGIFSGLFLFIGLIALYGVIAEGAYIWVFIPIILIVLGIGSLVLNLTKFR